MNVYWVAAIIAGAALLVLLIVALGAVVRVRRLARDAGSLRAGIAATTGDLAGALGAVRSRQGTPDS